MREFLKHTKIVTGLWALLMIISGALLIINPVGIVLFVCELLGIAMTGAGVLLLILYFSGKNRETEDRRGFTGYSVSAVCGVVLLAFGIFIVVYPSAITRFVTILFALVLMMHAIYDIAESRELQYYQDANWYLPMISSIVKIVLAILIMMKPLGLASVISVFTGIVLILAGISGLLLNFRVRRFAKEYHRAERNDIIDGQLISEENIDEK